MESLSDHLLERCSQRTGPSCEDPKFVLHWIRAALRFEENPTFDVARLIANQMGLPLLVYHGIDERYTHASYRHHKFLLEGARDLEQESADIGVDYLLHVSRDGHRQRGCSGRCRSEVMISLTWIHGRIGLMLSPRCAP